MLTAFGVRAALGALTATLLALSSTAKAGSVQVVHAFTDDGKGYQPLAPLIRLGPYLYGTTYQPGPDAQGGIIYRLSQGGRYKIIHRFTTVRGGVYPQTGLTALDGVLYGTTSGGGPNGYGVIYSLTTEGAFSIIHAFTEQEGSYPSGRLLAVKNTLYGVTSSGGPNGKGTVFSITPNGAFTLLHAFAGGAMDGAYPRGSLFASGDFLYGTTEEGGVNGYGTVYSLTAAGEIKVLHAFAADASGFYPVSGLVKLGQDFFGTTEETSEAGGTLYAIRANGQFGVVHTFEGGGDGDTPTGDLSVGHDLVYGTTSQGGDDDNGVVFSYATSTGYSLVASLLDSATDGSGPTGGLVADRGALFGTTSTGGPGGGGVVFSVAP